ncbi:unnamed protein product, partial [Closterium sp. NIES-65]
VLLLIVYFATLGPPLKLVPRATQPFVSAPSAFPSVHVTKATEADGQWLATSVQVTVVRTKREAGASIGKEKYGENDNTQQGNDDNTQQGDEDTQQWDEDPQQKKSVQLAQLAPEAQWEQELWPKREAGALSGNEKYGDITNQDRDDDTQQGDEYTQQKKSVQLAREAQWVTEQELLHEEEMQALRKQEERAQQQEQGAPQQEQRAQQQEQGAPQQEQRAQQQEQGAPQQEQRAQQQEQGAPQQEQRAQHQEQLTQQKEQREQQKEQEAQRKVQRAQQQEQLTQQKEQRAQQKKQGTQQQRTQQTQQQEQLGPQKQEQQQGQKKQDSTEQIKPKRKHRKNVDVPPSSSSTRLDTSHAASQGAVGGDKRKRAARGGRDAGGKRGGGSAGRGEKPSAVTGESASNTTATATTPAALETSQKSDAERGGGRVGRGEKPTAATGSASNTAATATPNPARGGKDAGGERGGGRAGRGEKPRATTGSASNTTATATPAASLDIPATAAAKASGAADLPVEMGASASVSVGAACQGRAIYVYPLSARFNQWMVDDCLESHSADFLFIPAYLGWSIWSLVEHGLFVDRDQPGIELERYLLEENPDFKRLVDQGNHVLVLGRPIWDFRRVKEWGSDLWWRPTFNNVTLLTVEATREWYGREVFSIPYPTSFHPVGSAELQGWMNHARDHARPYLYAFVGGRRAKETIEGALRGALLQECENEPEKCLLLECYSADAEAVTEAAAEIGREAASRKAKTAAAGGKGEGIAENIEEEEPKVDLPGCTDPRRVAGAMLQSEFCLQPVGDSQTRRSFFDSIIAGCIPVVFSTDTFDSQYPWFFDPKPEARRKIAVMVDPEEVISGRVKIGEVLGKISVERKEEMRKEMRLHVPRLLLRDHAREGEVGEEGLFEDMELHRATEVSDSAVSVDDVGAKMSGLDPEEPWQQNQQEQQSQQYEQEEQDEKNRQDQLNQQDEKDQQNEQGQTATPRLETQAERQKRSADFLFIPAYLGWSIWSLVEHGLFEKRDDPVIELERYLLEENADFKRMVNRGDHVLVLGRPIWDFKRDQDKPEGWGTDLWWRPTFKNVTLLTVEAPPEWYEREVFSVPYPTCFHPVGSAELQGWVRHVQEQPRPYLYSFVGGKRAHATWEGSLRGILLNDCENDPKRCIFLECTVADAEAATAAAADIGRQAQKRKEERDSMEGKGEEDEIEPDFPLRGCMDPRRVTGVMLQSEFCLQPIGDSLTRRSFFDSIIAGCIPVVFAPGTFDYQYPWFFAIGDEARRNVSVMVDSDDVIGRKVRIGEVLGGISEERKREMREELYKHIPRLLLRDHTKEGEVGEEGVFVDMVDRTIEGLIERKKMRRAGVAGSYFPL